MYLKNHVDYNMVLFLLHFKINKNKLFTFSESFLMALDTILLHIKIIY